MAGRTLATLLIMVLVALAVHTQRLAEPQEVAAQALVLCPTECTSAGCDTATGGPLDVVNWHAGSQNVPGGVLCTYEDVYGETWQTMILE